MQPGDEVAPVEAGLRENGRFKRGSIPDNHGAVVSAWKGRVQAAGVILDHAPELADRRGSGAE